MRTVKGKFSRHLKPTENALQENKCVQGQILMHDNSRRVRPDLPLQHTSSGLPQGTLPGVLKNRQRVPGRGCWEGTCLHASAQQRHPVNLHTRDISSLLYLFLSPLPSQTITPSSRRADIPAPYRKGKAHPYQEQPSHSTEPRKLEDSQPRQQRLNDNGMACARRLLTVYGFTQLQSVRPCAPWHGELARQGSPHPTRDPAPCPAPTRQPQGLL